MGTRSAPRITHPESFQTDNGARLSEQALRLYVDQQLHARIYQKAVNKDTEWQVSTRKKKKKLRHRTGIVIQS